MPWVQNPFTGKLDKVNIDTGILQADADLRYLKLNQTVEQNVINGAPHFQGGIVLKSGTKLIFDGS